MSKNTDEMYGQKKGIHQKNMLKELARLHATSSQKIPLKKEEITKIYDTVLKDWNRKILYLENYIEQCEKKWYMSPFELLYCTIFHELINATQFAKEKFTAWHEVAKEKEDGRIVVNHGNIADQHFVYDENGNGLFTNFEKAKWGFPLLDLVGYFHRALKTYSIPNSEYKDLYFTYQNYFPYRTEEKSLFLSYLVFPEQVYRIVKKYGEDKQKTELQYVRKLQRLYWQLKNIESFVMSVIEDKAENDVQEEGANSNDSMS